MGIYRQVELGRVETLPLSICGVTGVPLELQLGWSLDLDRLRAAFVPTPAWSPSTFLAEESGVLVLRRASVARN